MTKLKLQLWQVKNLVLMEVLEQDESLRGRGLIFEYGGLELVSTFCPCLEDEGIFIRGNDFEHDNRIAINQFDTIVRAKKYIERAVTLVHEYNKSLDTVADTPTDDEVKTHIAE